MTKSRITPRSFLALPALLVGTAGMLSFAFSAQAAPPDPYAQMQSQLNLASAQISQFKTTQHKGEVLGASTTAPVRPVCRMSVDKSSYKLGESIVVSWSTTGATSVAFVETPGQEGKDHQAWPTGTLSQSGSATVVSSGTGLPSLTLKATSVTGQSVWCTKYFSVVDTVAGKKDTKIGSLQAQILKLSDVLNKLLAQHVAIEQKISEAQVKYSVIQQKIDTLSTSGGGHSTSTHSTSTAANKPAFSFIESTQILNVNDTNVELNSGTYKLTFEVTAVGNDVYVPRSTNRMSFGEAGGVTYRIIDAATNRGSAQGAATAALSSSAPSVGNFYKVAEGTTKSFNVQVDYDPSARGTFKVQLVNALWRVAPESEAKNTSLQTPNVANGGYTSDPLFI